MFSDDFYNKAKTLKEALLESEDKYKLTLSQMLNLCFRHMDKNFDPENADLTNVKAIAKQCDIIWKKTHDRLIKDGYESMYNKDGFEKVLKNNEGLNLLEL